MSNHKIVIWSLIVLGLALQLICTAMGKRMPTPANIYSWLGMAGTIILLLACALYAQQKGYSRNYGLLALLSILGVFLLVCLPDKSGNKP